MKANMLLIVSFLIALAASQGEDNETPPGANTPLPTPVPTTTTTPAPVATTTTTPSPVFPPLISGNECIIEGDPHFEMYNGGKHDFMGYPPATDPNNPDCNKDKFYYLARCAGSRRVDLPIQVIGKHVCSTRHNQCRRTSLAGLTFELNGQSKSYFVYLGTEHAAYAENKNGAKPDYDEMLAEKPNALTTLEEGDTNLPGGFHLDYDRRTPNSGGVKVDLTVSKGNNEVTAHMNEGTKDNDGDNVPRTAEIFVSDNYQPHACGLCGNFKSDDEEKLEICDGSYIDIEDGSELQQNLDIRGWSYEYKFWNNKCQQEEGFEFQMNIPEGIVMECDHKVEDWAEELCNERLEKKYDEDECCSRLNGECEWIAKNCAVDLCIVAEEWFEGGKKKKDRMKKEVKKWFDDEAKDVCEVGMDHLNQNSNAFVLELTKTDLILIALVLANIIILAATLKVCLGRRNAKKYEMVKNIYSSDEETNEEIDVGLEY